MQKTLVVLAGGLGSRYQSIKQLDTIQESGHTLMEYSLYDAIENGFSHIVLVINENHKDAMEHFVKKLTIPKKTRISLALQKRNGFVPDKLLSVTKGRAKPWGTGHAVLSAMKYVSSPFVVINADDFYGKNTYQIASKLIESNAITNSKYHMLAFPIEATLSKNGSVSRGLCKIKDGKLSGIEEKTAIQRIDDTLFHTHNNKSYPIDTNAIVSMNFWLFHPSIFSFLQNQFELFISKNPTTTAEFFLPFVVDKLIQDKKIDVGITISEEQWIGLTYPEDKINLEKKISYWIKQGKYPLKLWN